MFDIKHKKHLFWINTFQIAQKNLRGDANITPKSTTPNNFQNLAGLWWPFQKSSEQSGTKPNLVAKILATNFGDHLASVTKISSQN